MKNSQDQTTYRKATVEDLDTLTRLRLLLLTEMFAEPRQPAQLPEAIRDYFERTIPSGEFIAYLAFRGMEAVGIGGMTVSELPPLGTSPTRKTGCLYNMYTVPEARRTGVAETILGLLIEDARRLGLSQIRVRAADQGVRLYRTAGFSEPHFLELELSLDRTSHN